MPTPMVSVCIVTYNHERYIHDCIMSALAQQSDDITLEILIGDDQSNDRTSAIVEALARKYPRLIRYFRHPKRLGFGSLNYQTLISKTRGSYIAHLDGDDFWLPGKLREQLNVLNSHPELSAIFSNAVVVDDHGVQRGAFNGYLPSTFDTGFLLRKGNFLCHASLLYRAEAKKSIQIMAAPFLDYQIHLQLAKKGTLGYINASLTGYRVASTTSISVLNSSLVQDMYWQALSYIKATPEISYDLASGKAHFLFTSSWRIICDRNFSQLPLLWKKVSNNSNASHFRILILVMSFLITHIEYKISNFICRKVLRRPLKIYFMR